MRIGGHFCAWTLALLLALTLSGCGGSETASGDGGTPPSKTEQEQTAEPAPETAPDPDALTEAEIAAVNEAFTPAEEREGVSYANPICSFFTSY